MHVAADAKRYELRVPPLAFDALHDRLEVAAADAIEARARVPELGLPRLMAGLRGLLPAVIRSELDPWDWAPSDRWSVDDWTRHGAVTGALAAWRGEGLPSCPETQDDARRSCWAWAMSMAYMHIQRTKPQWASSQNTQLTSS
jgi:hypothetical protein